MPADDPLKPVARLLAETRVGGLVERARRLADTEERVLGRVDAALRPHLRLANLRDGVLVLQADSAGWATRARYAAPGLLRDLRPARPDLGVRSIRIIVRAPSPAGVRGARFAVTPSAEAAASLREAARTLARDSPALGQPLLSIAARAERFAGDSDGVPPGADFGRGSVPPRE